MALVLPAVQAQTLRLPGQQRGPGLGAFAPPVASAQRQADYIVAVVNSEPITNNEVRARMVRTEQQMAQQGAPLPPKNEMARLLLERMIVERAQLQTAKEQGIVVSDTAVDDAVLNVAKQNQLSVEELRRRGHIVERAAGGGFGGYQGILIDWENGVLVGASEPRKDGQAVGY